MTYAERLIEATMKKLAEAVQPKPVQQAPAPKPQVPLPARPETYEERLRKAQRQLEGQYNREWVITGRKLGSNEPGEPM